MLVLNRRENESIIVRVAGELVRIVVVKTTATRTLIGVDADPERVHIVRGEIDEIKPEDDGHSVRRNGE